MLTLNADPFQMGLLTMVGSLPILLFGLVAGAWADRLRRRPILILADFGRFALLSLIPIASLSGVLRIELLFVLAFLVGTLSIFFNTASGAYLPALVKEDRLVEGNSKLAISESVSEIAGPGLAGVLIQVLSAPLAILADALSFLVSALSLAWIRQPEEPPITAEKRAIGHEIREGLQFVFGQPILRALLGSFALLVFFNALLEAVALFFITKEAGIPPALFGIAFAVGSVGSLLGAALTTRITTRLGMGPVLLLAPIILGASDLLVPLIRMAPLPAALAILSAGQFFFGLARPLFNINQVSLRQTITPPPLRGRAGAANAVLTAGAAAMAGAFLGGLLGQNLGAQTTILIAGLGEIVACLPIALSPIRRLHGLPGTPGEAVMSALI